MNNGRFFISLYGPTGVGKTALSELLTCSLPIEIINMDIGQLYLPFTIGTAKPTWKTQKVPHHMFDIIDEPVDCSVDKYRSLVIPLLKKVWKRGNIPVFVGGSGFYLKSLLFPPNNTIKNTVIAPSKGLDSETWDQLNTVDPKRAAAINKNDIYRIKRALTIWHTTGKKPSDYAPVFKPIANGIIVQVVRAQKELYNRIDKRTLVMMESGWPEEVRAIENTPWEGFVRRKKFIGYNDILDYLSSKQPDKIRDDVVECIQRKTRNYAKRQMTFLRMLERELSSTNQLKKKIFTLQADLTLSGPDLYINQLVNLVTRWVL